MDAQNPSLPTDDVSDGIALTNRQAVGLQRGRLAAVALVAIGGIVLLVGWIGTASALYPAQQLPYIISGGLGGLSLIGLGAALWLSSDLTDEWTKLDLIESALTRLADASGAEGSGTESGSAHVPLATPVDPTLAAPNGRPTRRRGQPISTDVGS